MHKSDKNKNGTEAQKMCHEIRATYMRRKYNFQIADIVYITHYQKGSILHLCEEKAKSYADGKIIVPYNFEQLLELLDTSVFSVPHNSYIVNLRYVSGFIPKTELFVADGRELPMSRGKKKAFLKDLIQYTVRKQEYNELRTLDEQNKGHIHHIEYYLWLISIYLEAKQHEKIKEILVKLQRALPME